MRLLRGKKGILTAGLVIGLLTAYTSSLAYSSIQEPDPNYVSSGQVDATNYCAGLGGRLPTEAELFNNYDFYDTAYAPLPQYSVQYWTNETSPYRSCGAYTGGEAGPPYYHDSCDDRTGEQAYNARCVFDEEELFGFLQGSINKVTGDINQILVNSLPIVFGIIAGLIGLILIIKLIKKWTVVSSGSSEPLNKDENWYTQGGYEKDPLLTEEDKDYYRTKQYGESKK